MSLESWKAEFYPVDAKDVSEADALAHSLKKWEGLRKENLERHGCEVRTIWVVEKDRSGPGISTVQIDDTTCACCIHWNEPIYGCQRCPLSIVRGKRCDSGAGSPYTSFFYRNPEPMIQLIQLAIERQEKKS